VRSASRYDATGSDWTDVGWPALAGNVCDQLNRYGFEARQRGKGPDPTVALAAP
jgi:hypothetical protein